MFTYLLLSTHHVGASYFILFFEGTRERERGKKKKKLDSDDFEFISTCISSLDGYQRNAYNLSC